MQITPVKLLNASSEKAHRKSQITKTSAGARADRVSQPAVIESQG